MEKKLSSNELLVEMQSKNERMGESEQSAVKDATVWASIMTVIVCVTLLTLDVLLKKKFDFGKPCILLTFGAVLYFVQGKKTHAKKNMIIGVVYGVLALLTFVLFFGGLLS